MNANPISWAVLGVGAAGKMRVQAITTDPSCRCVGLYRGRHISQFDLPQFQSPEEAILKADAVAICSPSHTHADYIEWALREKRHVSVEYPIATSYSEAKGLFELAKTMDRVLHVAHIEVLSPSMEILRNHLAHQSIETMKLHFQFSTHHQVMPEQIIGRLIPRLHRLINLGGEIVDIKQVQQNSHRISAHCALENNIEAECTLEWGPDVGRETTMEIRTQKDHWRLHNRTIWKNGLQIPVGSSTGLFQLDHEYAMKQIQNSGAHYMDETTILHGVNMASSIVGKAS